MEETQAADNNKNNIPSNKKTLLQRNASWPLLIVYLAFLIGMFYVQQLTYDFLPGSLNTTAYLLVTIIVGIIMGALFYNLGKALAAKAIGYQLIYFSLLGFVITRREKKEFHYDITRFFDIAMQFGPKDDDIEKNPRPIFFGGLLGFLVYAIIGVVLFVALGVYGSSRDTSTIVGWASLFAVIYGFIIVLYEYLPFKQDAATDVYNLIMTSSPDDRKAYNIMQVNARRDFSGEDYIYPDFADYASYYRAQTLYYHYLELLYKNELEEAVQCLSLQASLENHLPDDQKYLHTAESVYLRYLIRDDVGAENLYRTLKSDDRKYVRQPVMLSGYRTALFVIGKASGDKEALTELLKDYDKTIKSLVSSPRVESEKKLFNQAYQMLSESRPELNLQPLGSSETPTEIKKEEQTDQTL